jgi:hypothetical protein
MHRRVKRVVAETLVRRQACWPRLDEASNERVCEMAARPTRARNDIVGTSMLVVVAPVLARPELLLRRAPFEDEEMY